MQLYTNRVVGSNLLGSGSMLFRWLYPNSQKAEGARDELREHGRTSRPCCVRIANCCVTSNEPATRPGSSHWHTWLIPFPLKPRKPTPCAWSTSLNVCWRTPRAGRVLCSTGNRHGSLLMLSRYGSATRCGSFHREDSLAQQVVSPGVVGSDNSRRRPASCC